ncbi:Protein of unknown function DUF716 [Dillenia turbinata]|uniref:Uncharacterized protein n=1 Tax=Dillenia turbinata TaxID=194707 RepID=A0AAN8V6B4_9MAGN
MSPSLCLSHTYLQQRDFERWVLWWDMSCQPPFSWSSSAAPPNTSRSTRIALSPPSISTTLNILLSLSPFSSLPFLPSFLDKVKPHAEYPLLLYIGSAAFVQELLVFHLHSTDHMGIEGQYHWLLQLVMVVCLITTILGIHYKKSFINSIVKFVSIMFQGICMNLLGIVLWIPKAKAIANLQFCWFLTGVVIFSTVLYLVLVKFYEKKVEYKTVAYNNEDDDVDSETKSFIDIGKTFKPADLER